MRGRGWSSEAEGAHEDTIKPKVTHRMSALVSATFLGNVRVIALLAALVTGDRAVEKVGTSSDRLIKLHT